jgi:cell wall-associated NlpC family hydrolase
VAKAFPNTKYLVPNTVYFRVPANPEKPTTYSGFVGQYRNVLATFTTRAATFLLTAALSTSGFAGSARRADVPEPETHAARAGKTLPPKAGEVLVEIAVASAADLSTKPDCSHFVHMVYSDSGLDYPYEDSRVLYRGTREFVQVKKPQPGDLIVWPGHVGIVVSRREKTFFSSVNSGILTESWTAPHWLARGRPRFFRYRLTPDTDLSMLVPADGTSHHGDTEARRKRESDMPPPDDDDR